MESTKSTVLVTKAGTRKSGMPWIQIMALNGRGPVHDNCSEAIMVDPFKLVPGAKAGDPAVLTPYPIGVGATVEGHLGWAASFTFEDKKTGETVTVPPKWTLVVT